MRTIAGVLLFFMCSAASASTVLITGSNSGIGYELANDARPDGVAVLLLNPGMVRVARTADYQLTKEGHEFARDVDVAAADIRKRIAALNIETSGTFMNGAGHISPW
jgi:short-subunit dehydrogenase